MERERKITVAILAMLVLVAVIAIVDISLKIDDSGKQGNLKMPVPKFGPGVGIVRVEGGIEMSAPSGPLGLKSGSDAIVKRLDNLMRDDKIKAVVLRINSPGGTVAATQEIYQKLWKLRKKNIVLVASMGDVAASGGYYIASACNHIVANHGTVTGSIGVIASSPNIRKLFEKLGIKMNVIKSGKYKDIMSSHRDLTRDERKLLQEMIDSSYQKFVEDVALGRNMKQSDIRKVADGRIMNGVTALNSGLVDQLGTFEDSIEKAKEMSGLAADAPVYEDAFSPIEEMFGSFSNLMSGFSFFGKTSIDNMNRIEYR